MHRWSRQSLPGCGRCLAGYWMDWWSSPAPKELQNRFWILNQEWKRLITKVLDWNWFKKDAEKRLSLGQAKSSETFIFLVYGYAMRIMRSTPICLSFLTSAMSKINRNPSKRHYNPNNIVLPGPAFLRPKFLPGKSFLILTSFLVSKSAWKKDPA